MRETGAIAPNDAEREKTMRKYEVDVPENVEMADIQAIQTRVKKHNLLTVALLIPLFAGYVLRESSETLGDIVFVLSLALMVLGFISGRGDEKRLPAYWAKYQQIHRMDNLLRANLVGVWRFTARAAATACSWAFSTKRRARGKTTSRTRFSRRWRMCASMRRRKGMSRWTWTSGR